MITVLLAVMIAAGISNVSNSAIEYEFYVALINIEDANAAGADVSSLIRDFNTALSFYADAENDRFISCPSYDDCVSRTDGILSSILAESQELKKSAEASGQMQQINVLALYALLVTGLVSLAFVLIYNTWRHRNRKNFLAMSLTAKGDNHDD